MERTQKALDKYNSCPNTIVFSAVDYVLRTYGTEEIESVVPEEVVTCANYESAVQHDTGEDGMLTNTSYVLGVLGCETCDKSSGSVLYGSKFSIPVSVTARRSEKPVVVTFTSNGLVTPWENKSSNS